MSNENENTYVLPAESGAEMARLIDQEHMMTEAMGGLFPEKLDLSGVRRVLDVACGPGGWALEVAFQHPEMQVTGIDISKTMIEYAQACAKVQRLDNATFKVMNVTRSLEFPDASFDLVNARLMFAFMRKDAWPCVIREFARVARPGGFVVLTESDDPGHTNAPALEEITRRGMRIMSQAGHSLHPHGDHFGVTPMLGHFLCNAGCYDIRQRAHFIDYSAGAPAHQAMYEDIKVYLKLGQPFAIKMGMATQEEFEKLYNQALEEMMSEEFRGLAYFLTAWGTVGEKP